MLPKTQTEAIDARTASIEKYMKKQLAHNGIMHAHRAP